LHAYSLTGNFPSISISNASPTLHIIITSWFYQGFTIII
jgi:hypothetical protein